MPFASTKNGLTEHIFENITFMNACLTNQVVTFNLVLAWLTFKEGMKLQTVTEQWLDICVSLCHQRPVLVLLQ